MLEIKNAITETERAFDGLISGLHVVGEGISEPEEMSIELPKPKARGKKRLRKTEKNIQKWQDNFKRDNIFVKGILKGEE